MKIVVSKYLIPTGIVLLGLGVILYFLHPLAPLLLVASILIQAPVVWLLVAFSYRNSYKDRTRERIKDFEKNNDAQKWLKQEEMELKSIGRKYWSKSGESLSALNRAQIYATLGDWQQVSELLGVVQEKRLSSLDTPRYKKLVEENAEFLKQQETEQ